MKRRLMFALLIICLSKTVLSQTTEFTYQGSLRVGSAPTVAPGTTVNYDFEFRLCGNDTFNCDTAPGLVGIELRPNTPVTDGIFTVILNFTAANAFDGSNRWLQVGIKPAGDPGPYTFMGPRTRVRSAPYSIKSKNADNSQQLGGVNASQYLQTNGNGSGLTNLNAGNITTGTLAIANGGTGSTIKNFVDLSTDQNSIGGNKTFTGNVGIGTTPISKLHAFGNGVLRITADSDLNAGFALRVNNASRWSVASVSPGQFQIFNDAIGQNAVWIDPTNNNVGIGSSTPAAKLEVNGYTKLGSDAPAIRVKKLTGTTAATDGGGVSVSHGLDPTKILSISVMVNWTGNEWVPSGYSIWNGYLFNWELENSVIHVYNSSGASVSIRSKPFKILVTYEQ